MAVALGRYAGTFPLPSGRTRSRSCRSVPAASALFAGDSTTEAARADGAGRATRRIAPTATTTRINLPTRGSLEDDAAISHLTEADPPSFGAHPPVYEDPPPTAGAALRRSDGSAHRSPSGRPDRRPGRPCAAARTPGNRHRGARRPGWPGSLATAGRRRNKRWTRQGGRAG